MGILAAFHKMGDDNVMGIIVLFIIEQLFEESEIVVVNIEVDGGHFAEGGDEGIVYDFLVGAELVEQEKDFQLLVGSLGIFDKK